jgi:hypothetical protein
VGLGKLGRRLNAGQPTTDHHKPTAFGRQVRDSLAEFPCTVQVGHGKCMLGHRGGISCTAQGVDERVVVHRGVVQPHLPALRIQRLHPADKQLDVGAAQAFAQRVFAQLLPGSHLVKPHPFHELHPGVDQRHVSVPGAAGDPICCGEACVARSQNHNAMSHRSPPSPSGEVIA